MFWVFHVIRDYDRTLKAGGSRMTPRASGYLALADELEQAQIPLPVVFGHNDLLPANFLDDGKKIWLIDFEYAGFNTAMFDLAGAASNSGMTVEESDQLLAAYFGASRMRKSAARTLPCNAPRCCARRCGAWSRNCTSRRLAGLRRLHRREPGAARSGARHLPHDIRKAFSTTLPATRRSLSSAAASSAGPPRTIWRGTTRRTSFCSNRAS